MSIHRIHLALGTALCLTLVVPAAAHAQRGTGARYGARDARACTVPASQGAPSVTQATQAVICGAESEYDAKLLYLVEQVSVQVGRGRQFQYATDAFKDVDPTAPVYPIRGSFVQYQCSLREHERAMGNDPNTNCTARPEPRASGICFTTTFSDLRCTLLDTSAPLDRTRVAPPR